MASPSVTSTSVNRSPEYGVVKIVPDLTIFLPFSTTAPAVPAGTVMDFVTRPISLPSQFGLFRMIVFTGIIFLLYKLVVFFCPCKVNVIFGDLLGILLRHFLGNRVVVSATLSAVRTTPSAHLKLFKN